MGAHYANVFVPTWALRILPVADVLQSTGRADESYEDDGLFRLGGEIATGGYLPSRLVRSLHEHEIPYDFFIEHESRRGLDQRGYWRPGMDEPRTWSVIDGHAFVWVSCVRDVLGGRGTPGQRLRVVAAQLDEAEPTVPDLRAFPDPRARRADDLRSGVDGRFAMRSPRRRFRL